MISIIFTSLLVFVFFLLGFTTQAFKKLFGLLTKVNLKILSFFGIKIKTKEKSIHTSEEFKQTYKDIKIVKLSKKNIKEQSSIDWIYLSIFIVAGLLVILNLNVITGNAITNWLYSMLKNIKIIKSATDMNTFYTATLFSVLSFSFSKILARWKETKEQRIEHKKLKLKIKVLAEMESKELLEEAKRKDEKKYKELK